MTSRQERYVMDVHLIENLTIRNVRSIPVEDQVAEIVVSPSRVLAEFSTCAKSRRGFPRVRFSILLCS